VPEPFPLELKRGKGMILVVDDDPLVRNLSTAILERLGYSVLTAENGQTGVEAFRNNMDSITAVLLDLTMPVMGGREALRQMNDIRADIPIVISTGYGDPDDFDQFGYASGGILQKPFTVSQLGRKMAEVVDLRKTAESKTSGGR
jgi:CheY-like chemotaxis protein